MILLLILLCFFFFVLDMFGWNIKTVYYVRIRLILAINFLSLLMKFSFEIMQKKKEICSWILVFSTHIHTHNVRKIVQHRLIVTYLKNMSSFVYRRFWYTARYFFTTSGVEVICLIKNWMLAIYLNCLYGFRLISNYILGWIHVVDMIVCACFHSMSFIGELDFANFFLFRTKLFVICFY